MVVLLFGFLPRLQSIQYFSPELPREPFRIRRYSEYYGIISSDFDVREVWVCEQQVELFMDSVMVVLLLLYWLPN